MEEVWWMWNEEKGELRDGKGRSWERAKEQVKRGKKEEKEGRRESIVTPDPVYCFDYRTPNEV